MTYKPDRYSDVSPYLIVGPVQATLDFLMATFDAEPLRRFERDDGSIMHAEVRVGDSVIMIGGATDEAPPIEAHVHVYVDDADAVYSRAVEAGAESIQAPERHGGDDPDHRGGVRGPGGVTWWIATQAEAS
jgi:uncharacterized glyoxalase superfamily protein PhnB